MSRARGLELDQFINIEEHFRKIYLRFLTPRQLIF